MKHHRVMLDLHYRIKRLAELYDIDSGWSVDRQFYLDLAGNKPLTILDIGCGTGLIANAYAAQGHRVTGLDPAPAMLDIARKKPNGKLVTWAEGDARSFTFSAPFDLIIMTGHAFQVLLSDKDIRHLMRGVRAHLAADGRFIFESRNPLMNWPQRLRHAYQLDTPMGPVNITRESGQMQENRITFHTHFDLETERLTSESTLYFPDATLICDLANTEGLQVEKLSGDWDGRAFDKEASEEMIFTLVRSSGTS